ncbi:MAG TPA: glucokinase [Candidatus Acidoferrales bacterium]|nr:glucokinase [Candidatus Acidoferrales bacterium]
MILAGDVGGTKCNLALFEVRGNSHRKIVDRRYESREFPAFDEIISKFLSESRAEGKAAGIGKIEAAGFGVAGPVIEHRVKATNLPWTVDGPALAKQLGTEHVAVLNDLEATGYGLPLLAPSEISMLNRGVASHNSAQALIAAGTGLGEAILFWDGSRYVVAGSEGGHVDFAPRTEREIELLRFMKKRHEFVSPELIISGRGFRTIHSFLDSSVRHASFDGPEGDAAPEITRLALEGRCPVCVETLDVWVTLYGAEAGNLALKVLARGGVWVAGGIAVKIRKKMEDGTFFRAFCEKEQFAALMAQIPIQMVLNEEAPLLGAMSRAIQVAGIRPI